MGKSVRSVRMSYRGEKRRGKKSENHSSLLKSIHFNIFIYIFIYIILYISILYRVFWTDTFLTLLDTFDTFLTLLLKNGHFHLIWRLRDAF